MTSPRSGSVDDDGALDDRAGAEDADLRLVDDRGVEQGAARAGVGQREGAATELVGGDPVGAGALGEVGDLARHAAEVEVAGVLDHRDEQAAVGVDGDAEVLGLVVGDRAGGLVDRAVDDRVGLERLDGREREERQERQLRALAGLEGGLRPLPQLGDLR